ncbi:hypothetical protein CP082626L3_0054B, partial [Chlamydia psittaci 08-2626_L3]
SATDHSFSSMLR